MRKTYCLIFAALTALALVSCSSGVESPVFSITGPESQESSSTPSLQPAPSSETPASSEHHSSEQPSSENSSSAESRSDSSISSDPSKEEVWSVIGSDSDWKIDHDMLKVEEGLYEVSLDFENGTEFKVRKDHDWAINYGAKGVKDGKNIVVSLTIAHPIKISFNSVTKMVSWAPLDHHYNDYEFDELQHYHVCEYCHEKADIEDHVFDEGSTQENGEILYTCTICGYQHSHSFEEGWTSDEDYHWHQSTCGHLVVSDKEAHNWGDWSITVEPTEESEGVKERSCTICKYKQTETIEKLPVEEGLKFEKVEGGYAVVGIGTYDDPNLVIPSKHHDLPVLSIAAEAFCQNSSLKTLAFETDSQVAFIGEKAFRGCSKLKSVEIPASVVEFGAMVFWECVSLSTVSFAEDSALKQIADCTFYNCHSLKEITIPSKVTSIGGGAFYECNNCASITFGDESQLETIGEGAFSGCRSLKSISIPNSITRVGPEAFAYCAVLSYNYTGNCIYLGNEENDRLVLVEALDHTVTEVLIKKPCKVIADYAFEMCGKLTTIAVPESVEYIGEYAFSLCAGVKTFSISSAVKRIGNGAFSRCDSIKGYSYDNCVYIGNSRDPYMVLLRAKNETITECGIHETCRFIMTSAFHDCTSLTSVSFSSCIQAILSKAFDGCSKLTSVSLPGGIEEIGWFAFAGCVALSEVNYEGAVAGWKRVILGPCWAGGTEYVNRIAASVVHCTDGDVAIFE